MTIKVFAKETLTDVFWLGIYLATVLYMSPDYLNLMPVVYFTERELVIIWFSAIMAGAFYLLQMLQAFRLDEERERRRG